MNLAPRSDNGIYQFKYSCPKTGKPIRISTGKRKRQEAEQYVQEYMATNSIKSARQYRHTLGESLWDTYRRHWSKQKASKSTYSKISLIDKKIGGWLLDQLTYTKLNEWFEDELKTGRKVATVGRDINVISKTLHEAHKLDWIKSVPPMPSIPSPKNKTRWLSHDEEDTIIAMCREFDHRQYVDIFIDAVPFLCDTGARLGELLKTEEENLKVYPNGVNMIELIDTKNGTNRTVPLTPRAYAAIKKIHANPDFTISRKRDSHADRHLELAKKIGVGFSQQFRMIADKCDMKDVSLHTLRHTCASRLVQGGMDLYMVSKWMGHSDIKVTQKYAHLAPSHLAGGINILSRAS